MIIYKTLGLNVLKKLNDNFIYLFYKLQPLNSNFFKLPQTPMVNICPLLFISYMYFFLLKQISHHDPWLGVPPFEVKTSTNCLFVYDIEISQTMSPLSMLGTIGKSSMSRGALTWFHNVSTYGEKLLNIE
jgi:hypothetical protein